MAQQSYMEQVAEEAQRWLEETPRQIADMLKVNGRSPFAAAANASQKLEYWRSVFFRQPDTPPKFRGPDFLPDGQPNQLGRQMTISERGIDSYLAIVKALGVAGPQPQAQLRASQEAGKAPKVQETLKESY